MAFRERSKRVLKRVLMACGVTRLGRRIAGPASVILMYHSVQDHPEDYANSIGRGLMHKSTDFRKHVETLVKRYNPVTLDDIWTSLREGRPLLPKSVAITFDDGYLDNLEIAAPILNRFGIRATFYLMVNAIEGQRAPWFSRLRYAFAITKKEFWNDSFGGGMLPLGNKAGRAAAFGAACERCSRLTGMAQSRTVDTIENNLETELLSEGRELMMNWDQARRLQGMGHIVGAHTLTHPNVAYVSEAEAEQEMSESKTKIEKELGVQVLHFSYPHPALNPNWNERTLSLSRRIGYRTAVTTVNARVKPETNPLALPRLYVPENRYDFVWHIERSFIARDK